MLKQIAWNTFKTTGNINTMLELLEVDKAINTIEKEENEQSIIYSNKDVKKEEKWEL